MSNLLVNSRDQRFILFEQLGMEKLFSTDVFADFSKDDALMILSEAEKMAVNVVLPTFLDGDREGCTFRDGNVYVPKSYHEAYKKYIEGGWMIANESPEVGGQGIPIALYEACMELMGAANVPFLMLPGLTHGAAKLIEEYGSEEQKKKYMEKMYEGRWGGTMCLTEPGAGTDVGALKTTAKRLPDGTFSITGTKIFISFGDQDVTENIIHPVLARIEGDPPGTSGISIFIVPKYRVNDDGTVGEPNDVHTGNIEHKMGIHGASTCTLNFGDDNKCIGELLGNERDGMRIMFLMMNEARLSVGLQGLSLSSVAFEHAVSYAKERIQSTLVWEKKDPDAKPVPIIQHPDVRRDLLWMKAHVEGVRALNYFTAYCMDMERAFPEESAKWQGFVELLTPVCKAYSSDKGMEICSKAIDVYGGYGYCQEYPVEQYFRDCKIATVYEGTNGIQALDLMGRKLGMNKGMNIMNLLGEIAQTIAKAKKFEDLKIDAGKLEEAYNALVDLTMALAQFGKSSSFITPILNASPFLDILGDVLIGHFLLQAAIISTEKLNAIYQENGAEESKAKKRALVRSNEDVAFYTGKVASSRFFAVEVLCTVKSRCEAIKSEEMVAFEIAEESFTC